MPELFNYFSTRELSLLIWMVIFVIAMSFNTKLRQSMLSVLNSVFATKIAGVILIMIAYVGLIVWILAAIRLFNYSLVKDLVFWFFSFALVSFFSINNAATNSYFKEVLKDCLKWTILVEFLVNFYTLSLVAELILFPVIGIVVLTKAYAQTKEEYGPVNKFLSNVLTLTGLGYFLYVLYKTVTEYEILLSWQTLYSFLFPVVLTICFIPFLYLVVVYMTYELLFIKLNRMAHGEITAEKLKWETFKVAGISLRKINLIDKRIRKFDLYDSGDVVSYIRKLT